MVLHTILTKFGNTQLETRRSTSNMSQHAALSYNHQAGTAPNPAMQPQLRILDTKEAKLFAPVMCASSTCSADVRLFT